MQFIQHEKQNNAVFLELSKKPEIYKYILTQIKDNDATLLVPQSVSIDGIDVNYDFIATHTIFQSSKNPNHFVTLSGQRGVFHEVPVPSSNPSSFSTLRKRKDRLFILQSPPEGFNPLTTDPRSLLETEIDASTIEFSNEKPGIIILREASVGIAGTLVSFFLIAEPVKFKGCIWARIQPSSSASSGASTSSQRSSASVSIAGSTSSSDVRGSRKREKVDSLIKTAVHSTSFSSLFSDVLPQSQQPLTETTSARTSPSSSYSSSFLEAQKGQISSKKQTDNENSVSLLPRFLDASASAPVSPKTPKSPKAPEDTLAVFKAYKAKLNAGLTTEFKTLINLSPPSITELKKFIGRLIVDMVELSRIPDLIKHYLETFIAECKTTKCYKQEPPESFLILRKGAESFILARIFEYYCRWTPSASKDKFLYKHIKKLAFLDPSHLEIKHSPDLSATIDRSAQELRKINDFLLPEQKMDKILRSSKIIFESFEGGKAYGADDFLPIFIMAVVRANAKKLQTNIDWIQTFADSKLLMSERGYYFIQLVSAVRFLETLDASSLSIDPKEFHSRYNGQAFSPIPIASETELSDDAETFANEDEEGSNLRNTEEAVLEALKRTIENIDVQASKFTNRTASDLRIGEIEDLLREYKQISLQNHLLKSVTQFQSTHPSSHSPGISSFSSPFSPRTPDTDLDLEDNRSLLSNPSSIGTQLSSTSSKPTSPSSSSATPSKRDRSSSFG